MASEESDNHNLYKGALLAMIALLAIHSSTQTRIHNVILFKTLQQCLTQQCLFSYGEAIV